MTLKTILWALNDAPVEDPTAVLVLLALADGAHDDGTHAFNGQATIARRARCSDRTVRRHLVELEAAGLIRRGNQDLAKDIPANRRPVVWELCLDMSWSNQAGQNVRPTPDSLPGQNVRAPDLQEHGTRPDIGDRSQASGRTRNPGQAGHETRPDRSPMSDESTTNQKRNQGRSAPISTGGSPPPLAALRAAERAACEHGTSPSRCAFCKRGDPPPPVERPPAQSHRAEIHAALQARRGRGATTRTGAPSARRDGTPLDCPT